MNDFFKLMSPAEFIALFDEFSPLDPQIIPVLEARGRILAEQQVSNEALPPFSRSTMDGFAVRAADTFGCSDSETALLTIVGEIAMGTSGQEYKLKAGQAVRIWTGGELPQKADAVVMVEYTQAFDEETVAVFRPVAPGENVTQAGEDYQPGQVILEAGRSLRPQDLGVLSGLGINQVPVYRKPKVAILSTGDELVPSDQTPPPGKIRDINSTTLMAMVEEAGGIPVPLGICGDDFDAMLALCSKALEGADMLLLSGGSSVGKRDFTKRVFAALPDSELLVHGVSVRPGKPTILARQNNKAMFGLPGHVASALVIFTCFVRPLIRRFSGLGSTLGLQAVEAVTAQPIPSAIGRQEYVRVRLLHEEGRALQAVPVYGKSGLLSPLVRADGLLPIGRDMEGLDQGAPCTVLLFPAA
ncbi:molybdopterin molybdotransferase MoeA [Desulfobulbus rhabdoformis]|uniref:molybdopterin molybdotransferase MoeA n=1 Tax=Desulfobulbus rhabdoformis TaxID=34032 RepID=UPI001966135C|nr:gephyrin-like molybdotransferase Glp [Desulfobulbus rhabdoformis]MBM9616355.1 molybdopterin molybdotransferase MoeA [Desulfobulbus rhabdoformis]